MATLFNIDHERAFGRVYTTYEQEVFQETYNAELLKKRAAALRRAQERVKDKRLGDLKLLQRLDLMGQFYDKELGPDLKPLPKTKKTRK